MWVLWKEENRRASGGIDNSYVHLRNRHLFLVSFYSSMKWICTDDQETSVEDHNT